MESAIAIVFQLAILLFSVALHEVAHGFVAGALGDPTAKYAGRLTLNPLKHLDPMGSVFIPAMLALFHLPVIGWARPVPYDPSYFRMRNRDFGAAIVGVAGPAANIAVAAVFGLALRLTTLSGPALGTAALPLAAIFGAITATNLVLALFNLVPIPPLDGGKLLFWLLPARWFALKAFLEQFGFILLLIFVFSFSSWLLPAVAFLFRLFTGSAAF